MDDIEIFTYCHGAGAPDCFEVVRLTDYEATVARAIENYEQLRAQSGSYLEQRVRAEKAEAQLEKAELCVEDPRYWESKLGE